MLRRIDSALVDNINHYLQPEHWLTGSNTSLDPFYLLQEENRELCKNELYTLFSQLLVVSLIPKSKPLSFTILMEILKRKFIAEREVLIRLATTLWRINNARSETRINLRQELPDHTLWKLYEDSNGRCRICRMKFTNKARDALYLRKKFLPEKRFKYYDMLRPSRKSGMDLGIEIDHIQPISFLGSNDSRNLQLLCTYCNNIKKHYFTIFDRIDQILKAGNAPLPFVVLRLLSRGQCEFCRRHGKASEEELSVYIRYDDLPPMLENLGVTCFDSCHDPNTDKRWRRVSS